MLFDVWGSNTGIHWLGWAMVFVGLIALNEIGRRTKAGAAIIFGVAPLAMTIYCVAIAIGVSQGAEWALANPTHVYQNSWFHYAKVYAALAGCWGFIAIKYQWGKIGKAKWFRAWPFVIVAINIMIAVVSDFESAYHFFALGETTWVTSEGATQLAGWNNVFNGIAGIINIFCMTGWWSVYASEDKTDMLWPDMTWVYIIAPTTACPPTPGSAALRCCSPPPWRRSFGTRAAGSRTAPSRWPSGACSRRCSRTSRRSPSL